MCETCLLYIGCGVVSMPLWKYLITMHAQSMTSAHRRFCPAWTLTQFADVREMHCRPICEQTLPNVYGYEAASRHVKPHVCYTEKAGHAQQHPGTNTTINQQHMYKQQPRNALDG